MAESSALNALRAHPMHIQFTDSHWGEGGITRYTLSEAEVQAIETEVKHLQELADLVPLSPYDGCCISLRDAEKVG